MTTFKIMSDLHLEFQDGREHEFTVPYDGEDALLLAGDVQSGIVLEDWFCELLAHRPVFYILGNHEFYHHDLVYLQEDLAPFKFQLTVC
jgi:predicted phosphodiesterase